MIPAAIGLGTKLLTGASIIGGASLIPPLLNHGKERRKELVRLGPDDFGDYDFQLGDRAFVHQQSLDDSRNKYLMDEAKKDGRVREYQRMDPSLQLLNGMTAEDFLDTYAPEIRKLKLQEKINSADAVSDSQFYSKPAVEARRVVEQGRNDTLLQLARQRADQQQQRLDDSDYRQSRDNKEDLRYNEMMERENKKDRRAAISSTVAGLVALGAAFAV
jgi:hypothetical protein